MKPTDVEGGRYVAVKGVSLLMTADELIGRCMVQLKRDVDPSRLTLRLLVVTGDEPTAKEEEEATELRPHHPLARASVASGCWLLLVLAPSSASSSPSQVNARPPGELFVPLPKVKCSDLCSP